MSRPFNGLIRLSAALALVGALVLCLSKPSLSKEGRDFTGYYEVSNPNDYAQEVTLKLSLRVFNLSGNSVNNATITLEDSVLLGTTYATFAQTSIPVGGSANLAADLTLPQSEFGVWKSGGTPRLDIAYQNESGALIHRLIELSPKPVEEQ